MIAHEIIEQLIRKASVFRIKLLLCQCMCVYAFIFLKHCTFRSVKNLALGTHVKKFSNFIFSLYKLLNYSKCSFECERSEKERSLKYIEVVMQFLNISIKQSCRSRKFFEDC